MTVDPSTAVQPVGNQVATEAQTSTQAATRQAQQSVQLTDYTSVYTTEGVGVAAFSIAFDVAFTQEPVMHHGMVLADFDSVIRAGLIPGAAAVGAASAAVDAYTWKFKGGVVVSAWLTAGGPGGVKPDGTTTWVCTLGGVANHYASGGRVVRMQAFRGSDVRDIDTTEGFGQVNLPTATFKEWRWRLYMDGAVQTPEAGSRDTSTEHELVILTAEEMAARANLKDAKSAVGNILELGADPNLFPLGSMYVKRWLVDNQGSYVGADMIVVLRTPCGTTTPAGSVAAPVVASSSSSYEEPLS